MARGGIGVPRVRGPAEEAERNRASANPGGFSDWGACGGERVQIVDAGCGVVSDVVSEVGYRYGVKEEGPSVPVKGTRDTNDVLRSG